MPNLAGDYLGLVMMSSAAAEVWFAQGPGALNKAWRRKAKEPGRCRRYNRQVVIGQRS